MLPRPFSDFKKLLLLNWRMRVWRSTRTSRWISVKGDVCSDFSWWVLCIRGWFQERYMPSGCGIQGNCSSATTISFLVARLHGVLVNYTFKASFNHSGGQVCHFSFLISFLSFYYCHRWVLIYANCISGKTLQCHTILKEVDLENKKPIYNTTLPAIRVEFHPWQIQLAVLWITMPYWHIVLWHDILCDLHLDLTLNVLLTMEIKPSKLMHYPSWISHQ